MAVARVSRINTTPVKSLRLHHPESVELGPDGALEDRRFLLVDDGRRLYNGKRDTSLVRTTASWDPGSRILSMTVPSGEAVEEPSVRSRPERGRGVRPAGAGACRSTGPWADALSDLVGRSLTLIERDDGAWATDRARRRSSRGRRSASSTATAGVSGCCSSWTGSRRWPRRRGEGAASGWARRRCSSATRRRAAPFPRRARTPAAATATSSASSGRRAGADRRRVVPRRVRRGARAGDRARGRRGRGALSNERQPGRLQTQIWSSPPSYGRRSNQP